MLSTQKAAKGFRIPKRTARLIFTDTQYLGAEVVIRLDVSIAGFVEIQDLIASENQLKVFKVFGDKVLESWNLQQDDGTPIPANGEGMNSISMDLGNVILSEWAEVVTQVPPPLEGNSNNGVQ